jgi:hypothetical protein
MSREVQNHEQIARNIFEPINFKNGKVQVSSFKPPANSNEISVQRLALTNLDFCFWHGKSHEKSSERIFVGAAIIDVSFTNSYPELVKVVASPMRDEVLNCEMPAHADIVYVGYIVVKGEATPPEYMAIMKKLVELANQNFQKPLFTL